MPDEAVKLDLRTDGLDSDDIDTAREIVSNVGFQPNHHDVQITNGTVNFQPFENTEVNQELLEKCVEQLNSEFTDANTQYEIRENRDRAMPASKCCTIALKTESETDTPSDTTDGLDQPEWRTLVDSESKRKVGSPRTQSDEESTSKPTLSAPTDSDADTEQQVSNKQERSEARNSQNMEEQITSQHQIESFADIEHTIKYALADDSETLVVDSVERGGVTDVDGLDYAVENNEVHCTCGETNLSKKEAIEHLNRVQST